MKKALLMGVSGAAMVFASSAYATGMVGQEQGVKVSNNQGQYQDIKAVADGGDAGKGSAKSAGGDGGSPYSSKYGNNSAGGDGGYAKAYGGGGDGGDAYASGKQDQGQEQYVSANQKQVVYLPDINVTLPENGGASNGGGAPGPGLPGEEANANAVSGDENHVQSPHVNNSDDATIANLGGRAAREVFGTAVLGDNVNLNSFNTSMNNNTVMNATNNIGPIKLDSGDSKGGYADGGDIWIDQDADNKNKGYAGDAYSVVKDVEGGDGGKGGDGKALSANLGLQLAASKNESEGGDGKAHADADSTSKAKAYADADAKSYANTFAKANNKTDADADANGGGAGAPGKTRYSSMFGSKKHRDQQGGGDAFAKADADGSAKNWVKNEADADALAKAPAESWSVAEAAALGQGGDGGDIKNKTANNLDQDSHAKGTGGAGGDGGDAWVRSSAYGGDNTQRASSAQTANAATGGTQGGNGGNIAVSFGTGDIGAISLGTVSGIATMAQNTGLSANQFTSFSINAHTTF